MRARGWAREKAGRSWAGRSAAAGRGREATTKWSLDLVVASSFLSFCPRLFCPRAPAPPPADAVPERGHFGSPSAHSRTRWTALRPCGRASAPLPAPRPRCARSFRSLSLVPLFLRAPTMPASRHLTAHLFPSSLQLDRPPGPLGPLPLSLSPASPLRFVCSSALLLAWAAFVAPASSQARRCLLPPTFAQCKPGRAAARGVGSAGAQSCLPSSRSTCCPGSQAFSSDSRTVPSARCPRSASLESRTCWLRAAARASLDVPRPALPAGARSCRRSRGTAFLCRACLSSVTLERYEPGLAAVERTRERPPSPAAVSPLDLDRRPFLRRSAVPALSGRSRLAQLSRWLGVLSKTRPFRPGKPSMSGPCALPRPLAARLFSAGKAVPRLPTS